MSRFLLARVPALGCFVSVASVLVSPEPAFGQPVLYEFNASSGIGGFVGGLGDVNADGVPDFALTVSDSQQYWTEVRSGFDGTLLHSLATFAYTGVGLGDTDGDGFGDFALSSSVSYFGKVELLSGRDASLIHRWDAEKYDDRLGISMSRVDIDTDGRPELLVGASYYDANRGAAFLYSTSDFSLKRQHRGRNSGALLGETVRAVGDVDADGSPDYAAHNVITGDGSGRVEVFSAATGALIFEKRGQPYQFLGASMADGGDVNGDGYADTWVGLPGTWEPEPSFALLLAGPSGDVLYSIDHLSGDCFSWSMANVGDANGDGFPDLLIGAPCFGYADRGRAFLYCGRSFRLLHVFEGEGQKARLGWSLDGVGDIDGDGFTDVIIAEPGYSDYSGRIRVHGGDDLFLQIVQAEAEEGSEVDIAIRGGSPLVCALLVMVEVDMQPLFQPLSVQMLDGNGVWKMACVVPDGLVGMRFSLQALAQRDAGGGVVCSAPDSFLVVLP